MRVYFLRHAVAADREAWEGEDSERPLTDEGREQMRAAARGLAALDLRLDAVYSSPCLRALDTARIVGEALSAEVAVWPELASGCDLERLAPRLATLTDARAVMLVGHEPDFSAMIGRLIGSNGSPARLDVKKGACCRVDVPRKALAASDRRKLTRSGELCWLLTPSQLALMAPEPSRHNGRSRARPVAPRLTTRNNATPPTE